VPAPSGEGDFQLASFDVLDTIGDAADRDCAPLSLQRLAPPGDRQQQVVDEICGRIGCGP